MLTATSKRINDKMSMLNRESMCSFLDKNDKTSSLLTRGMLWNLIKVYFMDD